MKRTPLKNVSQKQALLNARWLGIKDERLFTLGSNAECQLCGRTFELGDIVDADHIIPRSHGGSYDPENMRLVHRECHDKRHGNLPRFSAYGVTPGAEQ